MEHIDGILYINLEKRDDRKAHFLQEIPKLCNDLNKVIRLNAVYDSFGALGCSKSHVKALEIFLENDTWKTCAIFEDDFTFYEDSVEKNNDMIRKFMVSTADVGLSWELLLLASNQPKGPPSLTEIEGVYKVLYSQTTSGYIVNKEGASKLCKIFKQSVELLEASRNKHEYGLDMYWNTADLQRYCFQPNMGYQYACISDIENKHVDYKC